MLVSNYTKEIFRAECNPGFESLHCFAHLEQDISAALPYLNAVLGGFSYCVDPPAVTFKIHGKLVTVHARKIAINALKDEEEATRIIEWLKREINTAWENRTEIEPSYDSASRPQVFEILKLLPKTNCRECGLPTCMVFAARAAEGVNAPEDCPSINDRDYQKLEEYLGRFRLDL